MSGNGKRKRVTAENDPISRATAATTKESR